MQTSRAIPKQNLHLPQRQYPLSKLSCIAINSANTRRVIKPSQAFSIQETCESFRGNFARAKLLDIHNSLRPQEICHEVAKGQPRFAIIQPRRCFTSSKIVRLVWNSLTKFLNVLTENRIINVSSLEEEASTFHLFEFSCRFWRICNLIQIQKS